MLRKKRMWGWQPAFAECWVLLCCQWSASHAEVGESHASAHHPSCSCTCCWPSLQCSFIHGKPNCTSKHKVKTCRNQSLSWDVGDLPPPPLSPTCVFIKAEARSCAVPELQHAARRKGKTGGVRLWCLGSDPQCRAAGLCPSQSSRANCSAPSSSSHVQFPSRKCPWLCLLFLFQLAPTAQKKAVCQNKKRYFWPLLFVKWGALIWIGILVLNYTTLGSWE